MPEVSRKKPVNEYVLSAAINRGYKEFCKRRRLASGGPRALSIQHKQAVALKRGQEVDIHEL